MKAKVVIAYTLLTQLFTFVANAGGFNDQNVIGNLFDQQNAPIPFATVALRNANDSTLVKGELSDDNGAFMFHQVREGNYFIEIQAIGYEKYRSASFTVRTAATTDLGKITIKERSSTLKSVDVIADKPFIERQIDRTVVNVENSITHTNSSVLEIMEKLPGVQVTQEGVISLKGRTGVVIMIDGKPTGLGGQDLGNLLKGMPSSTIQKIEIITNPSSKYDAAGNAGIINIITKKNRKQGFNGSVSSGYGQGRYGRFNTSTNMSYKNKWYNLFLSYSYANRKAFNHLELNRKFYSGDTLNEYFLTNNYIKLPFENHNPRVGADFTLSSRSSISLLASGSSNTIRPTGNTHTDIFLSEGAKIGSYDFTSQAINNFLNYSLNSQFRHQFDTLGKELTVDLDYADYISKTDQQFTNTISDHTGNYLLKELFDGDQNSELDIKSAKADYVQPLKGKGRLEAGLKTSYVNGDSDIRFYRTRNDVTTFDSSRSNHFLYNELINAGYINLNKEFNHFTLQVGFRSEQTIANGNQVLTGYTFKRDYIQLFPSAFIDYKLNDKNSLNINVGKRIDRPAYQQMDPFRRMIDATTYAAGNPYLVPQISYNSEFTYVWNNALFATAAYSKTYDNITDMLVQDAKSRVTVQTVVNLDEMDYYSFNLTYSKRLTKWWNTNSGVLSYYGIYQGVVNNYTINTARPSFNITTSNNFFIREGLSMEVNFYYTHKNLYGVTLMKEMSNLTIGVQKQLLKKQATLTLNVTDIFWKSYPSGVTQFGDVNEEWNSRRDTRVVNVNFSYRFGKGQAAKMRRKTGADEEKRRAGAGS